MTIINPSENLITVYSTLLVDRWGLEKVCQEAELAVGLCTIMPLASSPAQERRAHSLTLRLWSTCSVPDLNLSAGVKALNKTDNKHPCHRGSYIPAENETNK